MGRKLIIYDGLKDIVVDSKKEQYTYKINSGRILGKNNISINNSSKFVYLAKKLRDEYTDYIYSLNKEFIKKKIFINKEISLFFFTEVSNKRTEIFDTYQAICHIELIRNYLKKNKNINEIVLKKVQIEFSNCIIKTFSGSYKITDANIKKTHIPFFKILFKQAHFFLKTLFYLSFLKLYKSDFKVKGKIRKLFFTRYPKHFAPNGKDNKYGNFFGKKDIYLISIISDGIHQNHSLYKLVKYYFKLKKIPYSTILLDQFISYKQIVNSFFYSLRLFFLIKKISNNDFNFKKINITSYIQSEYYLSMLRIPRLTVYEQSIKKISSKYKIDKIYFYLFEFSYGRYFNYLFKKYLTSTTTIGFQHGPNSNRHLMFFLSKDEPSIGKDFNLQKLPIPDKIIAENNYSKRVYEEGNYKNIKIMSKIYRLSYLESIERKNIEKNSVLVAAAMHDGEQLFYHLLDEMIKNKTTNYYFKFHPKGKNSENLILKEKNDNIFEATQDLNFYLSKVSKVIVTQSSVGYEAFILNIPVKVISLSSKINDSPLLDILEHEKKIKNKIEIDYIN